jgi:hypothetical protein
MHPHCDTRNLYIYRTLYYIHRFHHCRLNTPLNSSPISSIVRFAMGKSNHTVVAVYVLAFWTTPCVTKIHVVTKYDEIFNRTTVRSSTLQYTSESFRPTMRPYVQADKNSCRDVSSYNVRIQTNRAVKLAEDRERFGIDCRFLAVNTPVVTENAISQQTPHLPSPSIYYSPAN